MSKHFKSILRPLGVLRIAGNCRNLLTATGGLLQYCWYHKLVFGVTNTKFDISYCVFRESFLRDQYDIRKFIGKLGPCRELFFLDIGRNHGFVFYYLVYHLVQRGIRVPLINYYGIDPSPLKFVYFNQTDTLHKHGIRINYNIIDRAIVFNNEPVVALKYGEGNFGNFNITGSNYEEKLARLQSRFEYVELTVETMRFSEVLTLVKRNMSADAIVIKIDCKNRTDHMFMEFLDVLSHTNKNYLISCERDGSSGRDVSNFAKSTAAVLTVSHFAAAPPCAANIDPTAVERLRQ